MYVCVYVCVCFVQLCMPLLYVGVEAHSNTQHFPKCHSKPLIICGFRCVFVLCACVCMCVHELVCVWCVFRCVCVYLCAWQKHDMIDPCSLGNKPFEMRDLVPYMYDVEHGHNCDLTIV